MTEREALKLALEALETYHGYMEPLLTVFGGPRVPAEKSTTYKVEKAIAAAEEALAQPEQEPVAIKRMKEWIEYLKRKSDFGQHMKIPSEMSAGTCWELAIELEQFINTTPPQRTWVGLTEEEVEACFHHVDEDGIGLFDFAEAIEAKLKEKMQ